VVHAVYLRDMRASPILAVVATGCVATAQARFPHDVAAALAADDMRRLETDRLVVYYPEGRGALARRTAARITTCLELATERSRLGTWPTQDKPRFVMPELPFNNAFVMPRVMGYEPISVVPTQNTLDFATPFGLPPDPAWIGCHEVVHYVHEQQFTGLWGAINRLFGHVLSPQVGLDAWFWEGLATYYEDAQTGGAGRLNWPVWRGMFAAAYAGGGVDGSDLSELKRAAPPGHHYLVGSHFVEWLAATYGQDRLWEVIARQGGSVSILLDVNGRFRRVYGRSLSQLIGEFDAHLVRELPRRGVPADHRRLRGVGNDARYARAADGTEAIVAEDVDVPTRLEVRGPDGAVRHRIDLVDLIVPRTLVVASPILVSGMSFTADGRTLLLTAIDLDTTYQTTRLLRVDVASGEVETAASGLGPGAAVSPDGARYWVADVDGDAWGLAEVELATGRRRTVIAPEPGRFVLRAAASPDGDRLALSEWDGARFAVSVWSGGTRRVVAGAPGRPAYDASWTDDGRLVYLDVVDGRFQVFVHDLDTGARAAITEAPYAAFEPRAAAGTVRFLDRDGWQWYLAEVALPPRAPVADLPPVAPEAGLAARDPARIPHAAAIAAAPDEAEITVRSDTPCRALDGLFRPQLHALAVASPSAGATLFGLAVTGGDHLGFQRWAVTGYVSPTPDPVLWSVAGGYANSMLAPWIFTVAAQDLRWHHPVDDDPAAPGFERYEDRATLDVSASFGRVVRGTSLVAAEGIYTRDDFADAPGRERLGGGGLRLAHDNVEATRYGGVRRRLGVAVDGAIYPTALSTIPADLVDTRAELAITVPIPTTRRHAVTARLRHRRIDARGDPGELTPLEVGGEGPFVAVYTRRTPDDDEPPLVRDEPFPERLRFVEPLRGFEDWPLPARAASIAEASWRYPVPIDHGWATSLLVMPAILVRELAFELFGSAALIAAPGGDALARHAAAGGALSLSISLWRAPLLVRYQVARRLTDDEGIAQQVGIAVGL
jgi:hypothetical protein